MPQMWDSSICFSFNVYLGMYIQTNDEIFNSQGSRQKGCILLFGQKVGKCKCNVNTIYIYIYIRSVAFLKVKTFSRHHYVLLASLS